MKPIILFVLWCLVLPVFSQNLREKELKTTLNEVTVFLDGAQLFETGTATLAADKSLLRIKNLSPFIDEKSIQVKAEGDFTILSVNHKLNYLNALEKDRVLDSLDAAHASLENRIQHEQARLAVLKERQNLLDDNRSLRSASSAATLAQLKQAMDFYEREVSAIKEEEIRVNKSMADERADQLRITQQRREQHDRKVLPTGEIEILVRADHAVQGKFSVTYLVSHAGWFPKYDIRVDNISKPLALTYKAEVFQHTGVDWKNVRLRFSNGAPNQSGVAPQLSPWLLNYSRYTRWDKAGALALAQNIGTIRGRVFDDNGDPIPGVNVLIKGTTIGTVTDANGNYSLTLPGSGSTLVFSSIGYGTQEIVATRQEMNVSLMADQKQLSEVVVTGYSQDNGLDGRVGGVAIRGTRSMEPKAQPVITTFIENQTTVEIEVKEPYSVRSDGEKLMVDLKQYEIPAEFEYYAVPKIDKDAFLVARIVQWDQYNLLEGEANLYFEDAFVGRSILNAKAITDTLEISMGRDRNIVIGRTRVEQFSRKRSIGASRTETRGFKILVRNKKSQAIRLTVFDQIPVSVNSDITINPLEITHAEYDDRSGKLSWALTLDPQQQKELALQYEVKYPKRESVILE